jgi:MOSC domain-containing protein YiiM
MRSQEPALTRARLVAVCTGTPTDYGTPDADHPFDRPWRTSFFKEPVSGSRWLSTTNVTGDAQADTRSHGGPEKAVLAYSADHYPNWKNELPELELAYGAFAENLDIEGLSEQNVCLGDTWQIGEALIQINQARLPCWKISRRWRVQDLSRQVQKSGRTGWYHRVLREGEIEAGMELLLVDRPHPEWTIARCNQLMHELKRDREQAADLAVLPELAESWRNTMNRRATTGKNPDEESRLIGTNLG